jgi:hypothetical protein
LLSKYSFGHLGDVIVSVLAFGPKVRGLKSDRGVGLLRAIEYKSAAYLLLEGK